MVQEGLQGHPFLQEPLERGKPLLCSGLCDPWQSLPGGSKRPSHDLNHPPLRSPCCPSTAQLWFQKGLSFSPFLATQTESTGGNDLYCIYVASYSFLQEDLIEHF